MIRSILAMMGFALSGMNVAFIVQEPSQFIFYVAAGVCFGGGIVIATTND